MMDRIVRWVERACEVRSTWLVALVTFLWLCATAWTRPLLLPDEGRYVGVAWSMLQTGDYAVPRLDGLPFFHKPPLFYWVTALSMEVFGANVWAARMSSLLSATLIVALTFWFLKRWAGQRVAALSAVVLATLPLMFGGAQYANLDMTVAAMISATVITLADSVMRMERGKPYRFMLALAYGLAGLGFLAKGLIGIVLPGGVVFFWLLGRRRFDLMLRLFSLPGLLVFLLVSVPWMWAMQARYPGFFDYYIIHQHFQRFAQAGFNNPNPFWFYVPVLLLACLPWSLQLWRLARKAWWRDSGRGALRGLMLSWLLVVLVFFSIPTSKLVGYILPVAAPLAYFMVAPFAQRLQSGEAARAMRTFSIYTLVSLAICLVAVLGLVVAPQPTSRSVAHAIKAQYKPGDTIAMLGRYRFDLDFYLHAGVPALVVSDWADPKLETSDNWRNELYDAGKFEPDKAASVLIGPDALNAALCKPGEGAWWLIGTRDTPEAYPFLASLPAAAEDRKLRAWRVVPGPGLMSCDETPRTAPE